jgi:hypothetical protein
MNRFYHSALRVLGMRQQTYQAAFGEGSHGHRALVDLAEYSRAFAADPEKLSHDEIMEMHGRRQMFFRIFRHVKLTPDQLEIVARDALVHTAARLQQSNPNQGDDE